MQYLGLVTPVRKEPSIISLDLPNSKHFYAGIFREENGRIVDEYVDNDHLESHPSNLTVFPSFLRLRHHW